jgi:hypothetical protein
MLLHMSGAALVDVKVEIFALSTIMQVLEGQQDVRVIVLILSHPPRNVCGGCTILEVHSAGP